MTTMCACAFGMSACDSGIVLLSRAHVDCRPLQIARLCQCAEATGDLRQPALPGLFSTVCSLAFTHRGIIIVMPVNIGVNNSPIG